MSGIVGIVSLGSAPIAPEYFQRMLDALAYWGPDGCYSQQSDNSAFAYLHFATTPEAAFERQPRTMANGEWLVAAARLDKRTELCDALQIDHTLRATLADGDLIERAYLKWGQACVNHLMGDWSFAVWNPTSQQLFLARDQLGQTGLYYHANTNYLAFASGRKALLALDRALHHIDELYVAQILLSWPVYYGSRTAHTEIQRLPPAHTLLATPQQITSHRYWHMEEFQPLPLRTLDEAVEGFLEVFDQAVKDRLRTNNRVGVTLSGGLDSGSVAATAGPLLTQSGLPLKAYTSVPIAEELADVSSRFGDEWDFAAATAHFAGISEHHAIRAEHVTPLMGIAELLWIHDEPQHASSNAYWISSLLQTAVCDGVQVLLTGQGGNASISWTGRVPQKRDQPLSLRNYLKDFLFRNIPDSWGVQLRAWQMARKEEWRHANAVNPDLVRRCHVLQRSINDPNHPVRTRNIAGLDQRLLILKPGRSILGALWHETGAAYGVEVRDPTLDLRLVHYCLAVPEELYFDANTGTDRLLIRQAMKGRLPDKVRLNQNRGLQGIDIAVRLRSEAAAVNATLDDLARGPAADYLNIDNMRRVWARIQQENDQKSFRDASVVLLRGIMAGLFVQQPHYPRPRPTFQPNFPAVIGNLIW